MANVYGSSLDSMMQNEAAQQASAQNEANSYRNFLNNSANTNLRRREGDSLDRYRAGDIDVRRLDTTGMNDYRRGMITNDNTRIGSQERLGMDANRVSQANVDRYARANEFNSTNQYNLGLDTNKASVTNTDRSARANELNYNNIYNLGLDSNRASVTNVDRNARANEFNSTNQYNLGLDTNRTSAGNVRRQYDSFDNASNNNYKLGLNTNETSKANVGRQYDSADYASGNQLALGTLQSNNAYTQGMDANRSAREIAALPYDRMTATQKAQFDAYGPAGLRPQNENLMLLNASAANERAASEQTAYQNTLNELNTNYNNQTTGVFRGAASPNDVNTQGIQAEMTRLASKRPNVKEESLYNEALGNYGRQVHAARYPGSVTGGTISYPPTSPTPGSIPDPNRLPVFYPTAPTGAADPMGGTNRPAPLTRKTKGGVSYQVN